MNANHELRVFLTAVSIIMLCTIGVLSIWDKTMQPPVVKECAITFKGPDGNKHTFIGEGEVF
jgi:hypothetical protein